MDVLTLVLLVLLIVLLVHVVRGGQIHFPVMNSALVYILIIVLFLFLIVRVVR